MNELFNDIVRALYYICDRTGLRYSEINILIYCLLIPASWYVIVWIRSRKGLAILAAHLLLPFAYYFERQRFTAFSKKFYDANIRALEWLGEVNKTGYVGISLLVGIVAPVLMYGLLFWMPKKYLLWIYGSFMVLNVLYYVWVMNRF